jgi:hypothetical protein
VLGRGADPCLLGVTVGDPETIPPEARPRVDQMLAAGYRPRDDGIEDPGDTRVFWTFDQIVKMSPVAFGAILARRRKR